MRIGEIAEKTGLSISNIRFYEKKGLIGPEREDDNKYRNYTEDDLSRLNQIILYRKMEFSVDTISKIFHGEITLEDAMEQQLIDLKNKQEMLQGSIDLCQKIIDDQAFDSMDVNHYLDYVKEEEMQGKLFGRIDDFIEDFSSFTNVDRFIGGSRMGWWLITNPWAHRLLLIGWCLLIFLLPFVFFIDSILEKGTVSIPIVIFMIIWIIAIVVSFVSYRGGKKR